MALSKVTYADNVTVIGAENLNAIQDAVIALEGVASVYELTALTAEAMPSRAIAENPHTIIKYEDRYYRLVYVGYKPSEGAHSEDVDRHVYTAVEFDVTWTLYALSLDYFDTTANQVKASSQAVAKMSTEGTTLNVTGI